MDVEAQKKLVIDFQLAMDRGERRSFRQPPTR
jgi:hypothetical protein